MMVVVVVNYSRQPGWASHNITRQRRSKSGSSLPSCHRRGLQLRTRRDGRLAALPPSWSGGRRRRNTRAQAARPGPGRRWGRPSSVGMRRERRTLSSPFQIPPAATRLPAELRNDFVHHNTHGGQTNTADRRPPVLPRTELLTSLPADVREVPTSLPVPDTWLISRHLSERNSVHCPVDSRSFCWSRNSSC